MSVNEDKGISVNDINRARPMNAPRLVTSPEAAAEILKESISKPQAGRVYDYLLGGSANFAADRAFAREQIRESPDTSWAAQQNRKWLSRVVRHMASRGIRQFVDMGSGLPTEGNVHQIAAQTASDCRVVYIDRDPIAAAHSYLLLQQSGELDRNQPITADLVDYAALWDAILDTRLIDPGEPIGLLFVAVLHFVPNDDQVRAAMRFYRSQAAPGSYLAISHTTWDGMPDAARDAHIRVARWYSERTSGLATRDRSTIVDFFGDWQVEPPGIVWTPEWNPEATKDHGGMGSVEAWRSHIVAGIGRKTLQGVKSHP